MEYIHLALEILILLSFLYFLLAKSYFLEKGKNLATKEDIGKITREIETVKNKILISTQAESEFIKERKDCLLTFNDTATFFVDYSTKFVDVIANNQNSLELIRRESENIRFEGAKLVSSFMKLHIYIENKAILNSAEDIYNSAIKLQRAVISTIFQIEKSAQAEKQIRELFENGNQSNLDGLYEIIKSRKKLIEDHINERTALLDNEIYKNRGLFIYEISKFLKVEQ